MSRGTHAICLWMLMLLLLMMMLMLMPSQLTPLRQGDSALDQAIVGFRLRVAPREGFEPEEGFAAAQDRSAQATLFFRTSCLVQGYSFKLCRCILSVGIEAVVRALLGDETQCCSGAAFDEGGECARDGAARGHLHPDLPPL